MSAAAAVLLYLFLKENSHETVQNVQVFQQATVFTHCLADSQKKHDGEPDEGRHPSMSDDVLFPCHRVQVERPYDER